MDSEEDVLDGVAKVAVVRPVRAVGGALQLEEVLFAGRELPLTQHDVAGQQR